jgi:hypothetical protein
VPDQTAQADTGAAFPSEPCGSCTAPVVWAHTPDGGRQPFDADPVDVSTGAATHLLQQSGGLIQAIPVTNKAQLFGRSHGWRRHLDTCPWRHRYRRGPTAAERQAEMVIRTDAEYQIVRRYARGASVDAIRIAVGATPDHVQQTVGRICRFDRERARGLVARYDETHPEGQ